MLNLLYKDYLGPSADTRPTYIGEFSAEIVMPTGSTIYYAGHRYKVLSCELVVDPTPKLRYYLEEVV